MTATKRNNLIRAALRSAHPETAFVVEALSGTSGRRGYRNLAIAWTGGPQREAVQALVEGLEGCSWGLRAGYSRTMTDDERDAWLADHDAREPERQAARDAEKAARAEAGRAKRAETAGRKAALAERLARSFGGVAFCIGAGRYGWLEVAYTGGPALEAVKAVAGDCHVTRADTAAERAARARELALAEAEYQAVAAELKALGEQPGCNIPLPELKTTLKAALRRKARLARLVRSVGVRFLCPAKQRRLAAQPLLPMPLPLDFGCFSAPQPACRRSAWR